MNILITGASGHIGSYLIKYLASNYKIFGIYRDKRKIKTNNFILFDILKNNNLKIFSKYKNNKKFYAIIHLAGITANSKNLNNFNLFENNIYITKK